MKGAWRNILIDYKSKNNNTTLQKTRFPAMLSSLVGSISGKARENAISGFRAIEICPLDPQQVLRKVKSSTASTDSSAQDAANVSTLSDTISEVLRSMRFPNKPP